MNQKKWVRNGEERASQDVSVGKLAKVKYKYPTTWRWGRHRDGNYRGLERELPFPLNEFLEKAEEKAPFFQGEVGGSGLHKPLKPTLPLWCPEPASEPAASQLGVHGLLSLLPTPGIQKLL